MSQIVLQVISRTEGNMNGSPYIRYRLKLMEKNHLFETDGFTYDLDSQIQSGDIIEYMKVIGRLSGVELCEAFYKEKQQEQEVMKINKTKEKEDDKQKENQLNLFEVV